MYIQIHTLLRGKEKWAYVRKGTTSHACGGRRHFTARVGLGVGAAGQPVITGQMVRAAVPSTFKSESTRVPELLRL